MRAFECWRRRGIIWPNELLHLKRNWKKSLNLSDALLLNVAPLKFNSGKFKHFLEGYLKIDGVPKTLNAEKHGFHRTDFVFTVIACFLIHNFLENSEMTKFVFR